MAGNKLKRRFTKIISYFLNENVQMENKNFYLTALYAIIATLVMTFIFIYAGVGTCVVCLMLVLTVLILCITFVAWRNGEYKLYTFVFCIVINLLVYPIFYFLTGDIYNGVPMYFASGIILSFFLLEGKRLVAVISLVMAWDTFIIFYSYVYRDKLQVYRDQVDLGSGISFSFLLASFVAIFIIWYQSVIIEKIAQKAMLSDNVINSAETSKSRFLANMTHEIRTPINAIVGMNELILKEDLSPAAREQAETIKAASAQLLTIINNILVYSKLDSKKMELLQTKYSFKKLISEIIHAVSVEYAAEETEFQVFIDRDIPSCLYGDDIRIKQVFMYLLFSSMHQLPHGRMSMEVKGEKNESEHTVKLICRIAETGRGLSEAELASVFGAYNKYDSRQKSNLKGMGLELSICKEILTMMGGSLKMESVVGIGMAAVFEFSNYIMDERPIVKLDDNAEYQVLIYLDNKDEESIWKPLMEDFKINPIYVSGPSAFRSAIENKRYTQIFVPDSVYELLKDTLISTQCEEYTYVVTDYQHVYQDYGRSRIIRRPLSCLNIAEAINGTWMKEDYQKPVEHEKIIFPDAKVLIVDDSMVNLKVLASMLDNFQIKADMVSSGAACLNILETERYDLILLDQYMPDMDGITTMHRIRETSKNGRSVPILCITADFGAEVREKLLEEGFQDYVAKPVKGYYLERLLRQYLPEKLAVSLVQEEEPVKRTNEEHLEIDRGQSDPLEIDTVRGCENIGGNKEAYAAVLNTYYQEGITKLEEIPLMYTSEDLSLYITNVHSLKSSSASVGAAEISVLFKELELAGKENNRKFIDEHTKAVLAQFTILLDNVKTYLIDNGCFEGDKTQENDEKTGEIEELKPAAVEELKQMLANVNLKRCEELLEQMAKGNYGLEYNNKIKEIKKNYEMFEYHKVKELIEELYTLVKSFS